MNTLIRQAIDFLEKEKNQVILVTPEEHAFLLPKKNTPPSKECDLMPDIRGLVSKHLPDMKLATKIPDDAHAKKMGNLWKEHHLSSHIIVLSLGEQGADLQFLQNFTHALDRLLAPCRLLEMRRLERDNGWDLVLSSTHLKLVIAPPFQQWKNLQLSRFYRENPTAQSFFLKETPAVILRPVSSYLKNPDLKRELWKMVASHPSMST